MIDISAGLSCVLNLTKKMLVRMASEDTRPAVNVISPERKSSFSGGLVESSVTLLAWFRSVAVVSVVAVSMQ